MNKLLVVEDNKNITSGEYNLKIEKDVSIEVKEEVILHDINNINNNCFNLKLKDYSKLDLYQIKKLNNDYHIHIVLENRAIFNYHMLILNKDKHQVIIDVDMIGDKAYASIDVRAINTEDNSNLDIICNGYIKKDTKDNELVENLKGLITKNNDTIKISPKMMVDTNEVEANHLVTIGAFNKEELFYLRSRGLNEDRAKKILIEAFLKHGMKEEELSYLNMGGENYE